MMALMSEEEQRSATPPAVAVVIGVVVGGALTLGVVFALQRDVETSPPPAETAAVRTPAAESSARVEFAELYLDYLLKTYYVYERGFCRALLKSICSALLETSLLSSPSTCKEVPNDELVLAIGRYQHQTGLPVDGKAGPKTVSRMLGGGFSSRKAMAEKYCPGWRPPAPPASGSAAAEPPPQTVAW
jgi:hypothetical protein